MAAAIPLAITALGAGVITLASSIAASIVWATRPATSPDVLDMQGLVPVSVDVTRYMGTWFEQRRMDSSFENNVTQVTARYSLRRDGFIDVVNSSVKTDGSADVIKGIARATQLPGVLLVSFFPLVEAPYVLLYVDTLYSMAVVGSPSRKYLWLLTRDRTATVAQLTKFQNIAISNGYTQDQLDDITTVSQ